MTAPAVGALLMAVAVAWLALPPGPSARRRRLRVSAPGRVLVVLLAGAASATAVLLEGRDLALAAVALLGAGAAAALIRGVRARRAAQTRADQVLDACELLAAELGAGQTVGAALRRAAVGWPELEPAAAAERLGADVPEALRGVARLGGAGALRSVAAAWQVAQHSGAGLAAALAQVAAGVRADQATRLLVAAELSLARATARLMALLPFGVLALGSGIGGDPWHFLFRTPAGLACLAGGGGFAVAGLFWLERIARGVLGR